MTWLIVLSFLALAMIGTPLFMVFGAAAMFLFVYSGGTAASVAIDVFSEKFADSPQLVTIPLFTIAGYIMAEAMKAMWMIVCHNMTSVCPCST